MENFTRAFTVSGNVITDSKPTKKAGNAGENIVTSLSFTFSSEWDDAIKSIVFKTPKNRLLTAQTITGSIAPIPQDALDSGGTLQFSLMGAFADSEQVIRTPTYGLDVESTLSILGGTPLATYTNVVLDCQTATQEAITAKDAAVLATQNIETTDADIQAAEGLRVIAETARDERADADHETAVGDHNTATNDHTTATEDHVLAASDHSTAQTDHTQASNDHTQAVTDSAAIAPTVAEVQTARGGFANLDARLDNADLYAADLPKNGAVMSNTIINADFSNGTTGWTFNNSASYVLGANEVSFLAISQNGGIQQPFNAISAHKYYFRERIKADSTSVGMEISGVSIKPSSGLSAYEILSTIWTASTTVAVHFGARDFRTSGWTNVYVSYLMVIDLTAFFGAGNEPTVTQMDRLMSYFPNSWFSGNANITDILQCLIAEKASKTQEDWITPTLLNGAVGSLQYRKNQFGELQFRGDLTVTNANSTVLVLPSAYAPLTDVNIAAPKRGGTGIEYFAIISADKTLYAYTATITYQTRWGSIRISL